jgi:cyanophycin synthetase
LPVIATHRAGGGRAVFSRDERIVLATGASEILLRALTAQAPGSPRVLENLLAAAAAAWALGIVPELIGAGIQTFEDSLATAALAIAS